MACDTEWRSVDNNLVEAVVFYCDIFIVARCVLSLVLLRSFIKLVGVIDIVKLVGTK